MGVTSQRRSLRVILGSGNLLLLCCVAPVAYLQLTQPPDQDPSTLKLLNDEYVTTANWQYVLVASSATAERREPMGDYSKKIVRLLREWMTEAYERELHRELTELDQSFVEWREGRIGSGELSHRIHQYENGPSRELFKQYNYGEQDMNVAYAIVSGILDRDEIPAELLEAIEKPLDFYQGMKDQNELREPGA